MPRDYAKSNTSKRRPNTKNKSSTPGWLWLVSIIVIVGFVAGIIYLHKHKVSKITKTVAITQKVTPQTEGTVTPRFEFYSMLSKDSAPTETADTPIKAKIPVITLKPTLVTSSYIIQIASFKEHKPADELKAKLALQGVDVTIQKDSVHSWYRVNAGPYKDENTANKIKAKLQSAGYQVILRKQHTP